MGCGGPSSIEGGEGSIGGEVGFLEGTDRVLT